MKKLLFVLFISMIAFSCQKDEFQPEKKYLTIEIMALSQEPLTLNYSLFGEEVNYYESKTINQVNNSIVFRSEYYISLNSEVNLTINKSDYPQAVISVYAFTDSGKKSFKILDSDNLVIELTDNGFKDVIFK